MVDRVEQVTPPVSAGMVAKLLIMLIELLELLVVLVVGYFVSVIFHRYAGVRKILDRLDLVIKDHILIVVYNPIELIVIFISLGVFLFVLFENILLVIGMCLKCRRIVNSWCRNRRKRIMVEVVAGGVLVFYYKKLSVIYWLLYVAYSVGCYCAVAFHNTKYFGSTNLCPCGCMKRFYEKYLHETGQALFYNHRFNSMDPA